MNRIEIRAFARLLRKMSCAQLQRMLRKNYKRLSAALSIGGWFRPTMLIRKLKAKRKMIKARIKVKCQATGISGSSSTRWWTGLFNPNSLNSAMRIKFWRCVAKSRAKFPMPTTGGWSLAAIRASVKRKRKAYVMNCMGNSGGGFLGGVFGGFDGSYSNLPGILPGTTHTSIPRPFGPTRPDRPVTGPSPISPIRPSIPPRGGWPVLTQQVPYHTHQVYQTPPQPGGFATSGPRGISNPYSIPRPVKGGGLGVGIAHPLQPGIEMPNVAPTEVSYNNFNEKGFGGYQDKMWFND